MPTWEILQDQQDIHQLVEHSFERPCLIFKHSSRCSISSFARHRLENSWDFSAEEIKPYFLDLINYRPVSNFVAEHFGVTHESPQVLLIRDGVCTYHASHLDIGVGDLRDRMISV
jgi:bacillithiol system protein YtxJ